MKQPFLTAIDDIWNATNDSKTWFNEQLFAAYNKQLLPSVQGSHTPEMRSMLQNNVSRFAGWKTNAVVQQLLDAKKAANGNKAAYEVIAKSVINTHGSYLGAEYQTALRRNNTALQWAQFQKEKHLYPNIQWLPSRSSNPDIVHKGYWNRIYPMGDDFWKTNQPGNRWGCKCSWKTTDVAPTDNSDVVKVNASQGLDKNPFDAKEIFTDSHPYYKNASTDWIKDAGPLRNVDEICYVPYSDKNGNIFHVHYNAITEYNDTNYQYINALIKLGYKDIKLLPKIVEEEKELRIRYFGHFFEGKKCPDAKSGDLIIEFKSVENGNKMRRNIIDAIGKASRKSDIVVVELKKNLTDLKTIKEKMLKTYSKLKDVIFLVNGIPVEL